MRNELSGMKEVRDTFQGIFVQYGTKLYKGHSSVTLLLKNVTKDGKLLTDHLWFTETEGFRKYQFKKGDVIEFTARVKQYKKGYVNRKIGVNETQYDYKLSHPTQIKIVP